MIRVTITVDMDEEIWGTEECFEHGGAAAVEDLCKEDLYSFIEDATWHVEKVTAPATPQLAASSR